MGDEWAACAIGEDLHVCGASIDWEVAALRVPLRTVAGSMPRSADLIWHFFLAGGKVAPVRIVDGVYGRRAGRSSGAELALRTAAFVAALLRRCRICRSAWVPTMALLPAD